MDSFLVLLTAIREWLTALQEEQPWLTPVLVLVCLVLGEVARRNVRKSHRIRQEAEEKNERLEADLRACKSAIERLKIRLPETAWDLVNRERIDGNEESAIRVLRRHMETEGAHLSEMARQIARFHLGLVTERDRNRHLVPAERFALLAFYLDPRQGEAGELLKEIQRLRGDQRFEHVQFTDDVAIAEDLSGGYYSLELRRMR